MTAEMAEPLRAAVQRYFDGHATGSPSVMRRAFHESARLQFIGDGGYSAWSLRSISPGCRAGQPTTNHSARAALFRCGPTGISRPPRSNSTTRPYDSSII